MDSEPYLQRCAPCGHSGQQSGMSDACSPDPNILEGLATSQMQVFVFNQAEFVDKARCIDSPTPQEPGTGEGWVGVERCAPGVASGRTWMVWQWFLAVLRVRGVGSSQ
jgi:hypothetical protein